MDTSTLPDTPVGRQAAWLLDVSAAGTAEIADIEAHLAAPFLAAVPAEALQGMLAGMAAQLVDAEVGRIDHKAPSQIAVELRTPSGPWFRVDLAVMPGDDGLIAGANISAAAPGSGGLPWDDLLAAEPAGATTSTLSETLVASLDAAAQAFRAEHKVPGLIVGVSDATGTLEYVATLGVSSLEPLTAVDAGNVVRIGSISKTFTAAAVVQLAADKKVDLDADVNDALTSYRVEGPDGEVLTVRQLLTHSSGLGARPRVDIGAADGEPIPTAAEFYGPVLTGQAAPRTEWTYSNDAFFTLGQLVADVSGTTFEQYAIDHIFEPLGMAETSFVRDERVTAAPLQGIDVSFGEASPVPFRDIIVRPAGSVFSTLADMASYAAAVMGRGTGPTGTYLDADAFETMSTAQDVTTPPGFKAQQCLSWLWLESDAGPVLWHNGGWAGANSELAVDLERGRAVHVFANTMVGGPLDAFALELVGLLAKG